jgi:hypothetical protein
MAILLSLKLTLKHHTSCYICCIFLLHGPGRFASCFLTCCRRFAVFFLVLSVSPWSFWTSLLHVMRVSLQALILILPLKESTELHGKGVLCRRFECSMTFSVQCTWLDVYQKFRGFQIASLLKSFFVSAKGSGLSKTPMSEACGRKILFLSLHCTCKVQFYVPSSELTESFVQPLMSFPSCS